MHPIVTFGRVGASRINNVEELSDKRIGVIKGWATTDYFMENHPDFELVEFTGILEALSAISNNCTPSEQVGLIKGIA